MDVVEDFLTGESSGADRGKDNKKATLICQDGKSVGVRDDGTVLVGDAMRIMKFNGKFGGGSEEGSSLVDEDNDDPEIFMEIPRKDGAPLSVFLFLGYILV